MAEGPMMLLMLGGIMAVSSFLAGILPLSISLSQRQLRIVTGIGSGILVGTALVIIVPEGVGALYGGHGKGHGHEAQQKDGDMVDEGPNHSVIGITLVLGFALMYVIDVVPPLLSRRPGLEGHIPLVNGDVSEPDTPYKAPSQASHSHATTIGLVIHSFADGIALGASSTTPSVGLIVFAAIMLHKAPAAFGLTTTLLKQELSKREARAHLAMFSLAAPVGALVTWALVGLLAGHGVAGENEYWTGVALIFSGGTFLYVAMHAMQSSGSSGSMDHSSTASPRKLEVGYTLLGMLLPLLTQFGHKHAHAH